MNDEELAVPTTIEAPNRERHHTHTESSYHPS